MFYHFKIIIRSLRRNGVFSIINILGLSVSLAVVLLMYLQIDHERSFDRSFKESKNIYRVNSLWHLYRPGETTAGTPAGFALAMKEGIPGVEAAVRIYRRSHILKAGDYEADTRINWADEDFFRLFDTPAIYGSPDDALKRPNVLALSETTAKMLFGDRNPVGETVLFGPQSMEISAVYRDFPKNSSFSGYHIIASLVGNMPMINDPRAKNEGSFETFCLLHADTDTARVGEQLRQMAANDFKDQGYTFSMQALNRMHLHSGGISGSGISTPGSADTVNMLSMLAVIILLIACINYMNLSTARAQKRSREIGISKTIGARRWELAVRLFLETGLLTTLSFVLAFGLAYLLLPLFNSLLGVQLHIGLALNGRFLLGALAILVLTTAIAASYPAFYLSGFPPLLAIRSAVSVRGSQSAIIRQVLTIGQFTAAIVLIAWVLVVYTQLQYVNSKDMGYNFDRIISFWIRTNKGPDFTAFENAMRAQSSVQEISRVSYFPSIGDNALLKRDMDDKGVNMALCGADEHLIDLLQLKMIAGKPLPARLPDDTIAQIVLNRKAVEYIGSTPEDIIGKRLHCDLREPVIVCGVVENFNYESLYQPIGEYGIHNSRFARGRFYLMARVSGSDLPNQIKTYEKLFKEHYPNDMFDVHYPELEMKRAYRGMTTTSRISLSFSILAILVACLGVFGLTAYMAEQRTREIGIRKVLGASAGNIVALFTGNYTKLLLISLAIAIPVAWWTGNRYLQDFAYRISIQWWMFVAAAAITVALTLFTVGVLAIKAATANPVKAIKSE
jgi:ABC-type antimicrobial peptide transport system permease subunit